MAMGMSMKSKFAVATKIVAIDGSGDFDNIQDAIDDLPSGGGAVYIKEGLYNIISTISISKSNVALLGSGNGTIIKSTSNNYITLISASSKSRILLRDFKLDGNYPNLAGGIQEGILLTSCTFCRISNCDFNAIGDSAILLTGDSDNNIISDCYTHTPSSQGEGLLLTEGASKNVISNCIFTGGSSTPGIYIYGNGVSTNNNTIRGCICSGQEGIFLSAEADNNVLIGNICNSNTTGIYIEDDSDQNILIGNQCLSNSHGIDIAEANCNKNIVLGNICLSNSTTNLSDSGTGTELGHNITV